jgi:hypothetical protein
MTGHMRIQRLRSKGWKMPENTIYVGRPSKFGNPFDLRKTEYSWYAISHGFKANRTGRAAASVEMYEDWIAYGKAVEFESGLLIEDTNSSEKIASSPRIQTKTPPTHDEIITQLRGKNLACWCKLGQPCHADILLELSNK